MGSMDRQKLTKAELAWRYQSAARIMGVLGVIGLGITISLAIAKIHVPRSATATAGIATLFCFTHSLVARARAKRIQRRDAK